MRFIPLACGLALAFGLAERATAQTAPYSAVITSPAAEVRCGPSYDPRFYPTNQLKKGDVVQVYRERPDGWLEIQPPAGSYSWIDYRQLQVMQPGTFVVVAPAGTKVEVVVGSAIFQGKPSVANSKVERGAQVHQWRDPMHGPGALLADGATTLLPIDPPPGEVRYLRAEAISKTPAATPAASIPPAQPPSVPPQPLAPSSSSFSPTAPPPGAPATTSDKPTHAEVDEIYDKAVAAERAGNIPLAIQLYAKAGALGLAINHVNARLALARANCLLGMAPPATQPTIDSRLRPATPPEPTAVQVHLTRPMSPSAVAEQPTATTAATYTTSRQVSATPTTYQWIGKLRRSGRRVGDRPTYVLESETGVPIMYATAADGLNLEPYVAHYVELFGTANYSGEYRANYMTVTQLRLIQ